MTRTAVRAISLAACVLLFWGGLPAQTRGGLALSLGFTESEKPAVSVTYFHRIVPVKIYATGGFSFFHPGSQIDASKDSEVYFASVTQLHGGIQFGEVFFVAPRITYNWYGPYHSMGWGISGGLSVRLSPKISLGVAAARDYLRFDDAVDRYGPSPFTSISVTGRFWFIR